MHQDSIYIAPTTVCGSRFSQTCSTSPRAKGIICKMLQCWCRINAISRFHKDCNCILEAAGPMKACVFVSWHSRVPCMHSHTYVMNLCIMPSGSFHSFLVFSSRERKHPSSQLRNECGQKKKGERINCEEKTRAEREVASCFCSKSKWAHSIQNEGSIWFAITPQMISQCLKLIGFLY